MFGKAAETGVARSQSLIQEGVTVRGDMKADGDVRLDGALEGTLFSKSRVTIGATGKIRADIEAAEILVMGEIHGKITGHKRIELRKGARLVGDISTQSLVIEEGVFFQGLCQMTEATAGATAGPPGATQTRDVKPAPAGGSRDQIRSIYSQSGSSHSN
ncbi:MAG: polymer-forming cytoskeletal protein [Candidatus Eisenbacteria bacterium]|nr:polymer-forming cytoskeletal protein [Candidatus Eisenbacteria bacterium]